MNIYECECPKCHYKKKEKVRCGTLFAIHCPECDALMMVETIQESCG